MVNYDSPDAIDFDIVKNAESVAMPQDTPPQYQKPPKGLIETRYEKLKAEQPVIATAKPYNMLNAMVLSACPAAWCWSLSMTGDWKTDVAVFIVVFLICAVMFDFAGRWLERYNTAVALVNNIEMMSAWHKPIFIIADSPNDELVGLRAEMILGFLRDEKCNNEVHKAFYETQDYPIRFLINFGFEAGREVETNFGLPLVDLHPNYFLLRGIRDEKDWIDYQAEVLSIAEQVDNKFAKIWATQSRNTYKTVAAKQRHEDSDTI